MIQKGLTHWIKKTYNSIKIFFKLERFHFWFVSQNWLQIEFKLTSKKLTWNWRRIDVQLTWNWRRIDVKLTLFFYNQFNSENWREIDVKLTYNWRKNWRKIDVVQIEFKLNSIWIQKEPNVLHWVSRASGTLGRDSVSNFASNQ